MKQGNTRTDNTRTERCREAGQIFTVRSILERNGRDPLGHGGVSDPLGAVETFFIPQCGVTGVGLDVHSGACTRRNGIVLGRSRCGFQLSKKAGCFSADKRKLETLWHGSGTD